ncbi:MAG TPA: L,D-transpeptidase family protein [Hansschlegelia sp.]
MPAARPALAGAALAAALALAGCKSEQAPTARSIQPLSAETVALMTEKGMSRQDPILLRIYKEDSKAEVWKKRKADGRYALLKTYDICRFSGKLGPKIKEGDKQAPEGFYSVSPAQMNPRSNYYLSFDIGYPNAYDRALGRTGQHVMMHGDCLSAGCYAMTDEQIGEIYTLAREAFSGGQKAFQVQALPFRMTPQNMARRRDNPNIAFWKNLKQGSDNFEVTKLEPKVDACGKKYVFNATPGAFSTFEPTAQCPTYQVQPEIAKAVAAKERADNIIIAQLSKQEPPAPEYVAQNGRMRRSLDEPVMQVAAATPMTSPAQPYAAAEAEPQFASVGSGRPPAARETVSVASATPVGLKTSPIATEMGAPSEATPTSTKVEGGLFSRMFSGRGGEAIVSASPAPSAGQSARATQVAPAVAMRRPSAPAAREVSPDQAPVMASSIAPPAQAAKPAPSGIGGWIKGVFGASEPAPVVPASAEPAPEAEPALTPKPRNRSASVAPAAKPNRQVASAFSSFQ